MARHESDREDHFQEATALKRRVELSVSPDPAPVVAGFHTDGRLSLYFAADLALHFDGPHLRRAYADGSLYRAQGNTLARLTRHRTASETQLIRHDLTAAELESIRHKFLDEIQRLTAALKAGTSEILRAIPPETDPRPQILAALHDIIGQNMPIAPALRG